MGPDMALHLFSVHHAEHGLSAVEQVAPATPGLARRLVSDHPAIAGAVVLSTCNRVDIYVDAIDSYAAADVDAAVRAAVVAGLDNAVSADELTWRARESTHVLWHLFAVGAGLDSMVVGEREIAGQLRRALKQARAEGTATFLLSESIEQALRTSRRVSHLTNLAATGRSVVSVCLDLIDRDWATTEVLLVGTGAYAGAVVADLSHRGCTAITVYSESGRAVDFARTHPVTPHEGALGDAIAGADVIVTCRGTGTPLITRDLVEPLLAHHHGRDLDIADLALSRDVEPDVGQLPGVRLFDLATVQTQVPDAASGEVGRAQVLVADGVNDLLVRLRGREMSPAVVALRDRVAAMVDDEINRLPHGRQLTAEDAAHALRRLAARLIHVPSVNARLAAEQGRSEEFLDAVAEVYGVRLEPRRPVVAPLREVVQPDTLDTAVCPVTGFDLADLGHLRRREAR